MLVEGGARSAGAGEDHLVLAAGVLDRGHDALGHVVVVRVHGVDVGVGLQDRLHHLEPEVRREVGGLLGDDLDAVTAQRLDGVGEALASGRSVTEMPAMPWISTTLPSQSSLSGDERRGLGRRSP